VHHGVNPEYQDKNFAGTFIIWDRLFGTFEPERAPVVYGITKPLASWNPVWANVHVFADIARNVRAARGFSNRLRAVFGHPGWRPPELGAPTVPGPVSPESFVKFEPQVPGWLRLYALVQFGVVLVGSVALLEAVGSLSAGHLMAGTFYIAVSLVNIGGVLEARSWASVSEVARLTVLGGAAALLWWQGTGPAWLLAAAMVFAVASVVWVVVLRPRFGPSDARPILVM
jgi:hypothetical protein